MENLRLLHLTHFYAFDKFIYSTKVAHIGFIHCTFIPTAGTAHDYSKHIFLIKAASFNPGNCSLTISVFLEIRRLQTG